ncbi:MAG: hypothetical protein WCI52_03090 [bacterium]
MDLNFLQEEIRGRGAKLGMKPQNSVEIMLGITEEAGEVAKEVALFEKIGNKINWKRAPDKALLEEEISHLLVNVINLACYYDTSLDQMMENLLSDKK